MDFLLDTPVFKKPQNQSAVHFPPGGRGGKGFPCWGISLLVPPYIDDDDDCYYVILVIVEA